MVRKFSTYLISLFVLVGVGFWISQSYQAQWEPQLRNELIEWVSQHTPLTLSLDAVQIKPLFKLSLRNLELRTKRQGPDSLLLKCPEIQLSVSWLDVPHAIYHRQWTESLGVIQFISPEITLSRNQLKSLKFAHASTPRQGRIPLFLKLRWEKAKIHWIEFSPKQQFLSFTEGNGYFHLLGPRLKIEHHTKGPEGSTLQIRYTQFRKKWDFETTLSELPLRAVSQWIPEKLLPTTLKTSEIGGATDTTLTMEGSEPFRFEHWKLYHPRASINFHSVSFHPTHTEIPILLNGLFSLKANQIETQGFKVSTGSTTVSVSGSVDLRPQVPHLNFILESSKLHSTDLLRLFYKTNQQLDDATLKGQAKIVGTLKDPIVTSEVQILEGKIGSRMVSGGHGSFHRKQNGWTNFQAQIYFPKGKIQTKGTRVNEILDFQLTGDDLDLQELFPAPQGVQAPQGTLRFGFQSQGPHHQIRSSGSFWIDHLRWKYLSCDSFQGGLDYTNGRLNLTGTSNNNQHQLVGEALWEGKLFRILKFHLMYQDRSLLGMSGTWNQETSDLDLAFDLNGIPLEMILPKPWNERIHGPIQGQGKLSGPIKKWGLTLDAQSSSLKIFDELLPNVHLTLSATPDYFKLIPIQINPSIEASFESTQLFSRISIQAREAPVKWLNALMNKPQFTGGLITGSYEADWKPIQKGRLSASIKDGSWLSVPFATPNFKASWSNGNGLIEQAELIHSSTTIKISGPWKQLKNFTNASQFDIPGYAEGLLKGKKWTLPLRVQSKKLDWIKQNGDWNIVTPEGTLQANWKEPVWDVRLTNIPGLELTGSYQSQTRSLNAQFKTDHFPLKKWLFFIPEYWHSTLGTATLNTDTYLHGPITELQGSFQVRLNKGQFFSHPFEILGNGSLHYPNLKIEQLQLIPTSTGKATYRGEIQLAEKTSNGQIALEQFSSTFFDQWVSSFGLGEGYIDGISQVQHHGSLLEIQTTLTGNSFKPNDANLSKIENASLTGAWTSNFESKKHQFTVSSAQFKTKEAELRLRDGSQIQFVPDQPIQLSLKTALRNWRYAFLTFFGNADFEGSVTPKPVATWKGQFSTDGLYVNEYEFKHGNVDLIWKGNHLTFNPNQLSNSIMNGELFFTEGGVELKKLQLSGQDGQQVDIQGHIKPFRWDFTCQGKGVDLATFIALGNITLPMDGIAQFHAVGTGDSKNPIIRGGIDFRDGRVYGLRYEKGKAQFTWSPKELVLPYVEINQPKQYTLLITGAIPLIKESARQIIEAPLNLSIQLRNANMNLLKSWDPGITEASGDLEGELQLKGTPSKPNWNGFLRLANGTILGSRYIKTLRKLTLDLLFIDNRLEIKRFDGQSGPARFVGSGNVGFQNWEPSTYDLKLVIPSKEGLELILPELPIPESPFSKRIKFLNSLSKIHVKGDAKLTGSHAEPHLYANLELSNGRFSYPPIKKRNYETTSFSRWIDQIVWDLHLDFREGAVFTNEMTEAALLGKLDITGGKDRLSVDGGVDIADGRISYLGLDFDIRQARFDIRTSEGENGKKELTPYVRAIAESRVQTVDKLTGQSIEDTVTMNIDYAPVSQIKPRLQSATNPTLTQDKLLARVTQTEVENLTPQERAFLYQQQFIRLIDTSLATPIARNLLKRTGLIDDIVVSRPIDPTTSRTQDTSVSGATSNSSSLVNLFAGTKYTLEKRLTKKLSVGYGVIIDQTTNELDQKTLDLRSDIQASYQVFKNVFLKGSVELPNSNANSTQQPDRRITVEPRIRFGWWGNTNKKKPKPPESK